MVYVRGSVRAVMGAGWASRLDGELDSDGDSDAHSVAAAPTAGQLESTARRCYPCYTITSLALASTVLYLSGLSVSYSTFLQDPYA